MRVLVVGCGKLGVEVGQLAVAAGDAVFGLRRSAAPLPAGMVAIRGDVTDPASLRLPADLDAVVYAVAAGDRSDEAYRLAYPQGLANVLDALAASGGASSAARMVFVSSTGVYGQTDGSEVDEDSPAEREHFTGARMREAERVLGSWPGSGSSLRLGGIYGPERTYLVDAVRSGRATYPDSFEQWTNRIHQTDAARAIRHVLSLPSPPRTLCVTDREPARRRDVLRWLADRLGVPAPSAARQERSAPSFTNKRVSSARLVASGFEFRYPTYREGYAVT